MNQALWKMGALKHAPPSFRYFDPTLDEQRATLMKEIKLPRATQTHGATPLPTRPSVISWSPSQKMDTT